MTVLFGGTPEGFARFLGQPLNAFSNLRAALRGPGSSTRCPTIARGQPGGAGPVLLPGARRLKAAQRQT